MRVLVFGDDIGTFAETFEVDVRHRRYVLTAEDEGCRRVGVLYCQTPCESGFLGIRRTENEHGRFTGMVVQFLHETDLRLLLHGFVGRTVFADTERVVAPDEFHRKFHEGSHADCGFHIVAEDEERTAGRDDSAVERHTDHDARHGEFGHTGLQELTAEIAFLEGVGLLEESVGLVAITQIGGGNNHIAHVLCKETKYNATGVTGSRSGFLLDERPVDARRLAGHEGLIFIGSLRISLLPLVVCLVFLVAQLTQFSRTVVVQFLHFGEDLERVFGVASKMLDGFLEGCSGFGERCTVGGALAFPVLAFGGHAALAHGGMTDDEGRLAFVGFGFDDGFTNSVGVVARYLLNEPAPCLVFGGYIFGGHFAATRGELDLVGVVEHNQVVESEVSCQTACTLRDLFLHAAIGDESVDSRVVDLSVTLMEPLSGDGCTDRKGVSLAERTGGILNHPLNLTLRVSRRHRTPLTEVLEVFEGELTCQT